MGRLTNLMFGLGKIIVGQRKVGLKQRNEKVGCGEIVEGSNNYNLGSKQQQNFKTSFFFFFSRNFFFHEFFFHEFFFQLDIQSLEFEFFLKKLLYRIADNVDS